MLFLLKVEIEKFPDISAKDFFGYVVKEWEYFMRMEKRGKILGGGKLAGKRGAVAIIEADSNEELDGIVIKLPLYPFFTNIEVTPLVDAQAAYTDAKRFHILLSAKKDSGE